MFSTRLSCRPHTAFNHRHSALREESVLNFTNLKNSVKLMGYVGRGPEVSTFENGKKMATFPITTSDSYKKQKGENIDDAQWHDLG